MLSILFNLYMYIITYVIVTAHNKKIKNDKPQRGLHHIKGVRRIDLDPTNEVRNEFGRS